MSVDGNLLAEAQRLLKRFSTPARELIAENQYGSLEARLAGGFIKLAEGHVVIEATFSTETAQIEALQDEMTEVIKTLVACLERATSIIDERVAVGVIEAELLTDCEHVIAVAKAEYLTGHQ